MPNRSDDLPADAIAELASKDPAFQFLNDPREDIYSECDGEPVQRTRGAPETTS
jgi:hypothetical protein